MERYSIKFYLFCEWNDYPPAYRLYFNDTLLTERTYIWDNEEDVLQENLTVEADKSIPHTITIEPIGQQTGRFQVKELDSELNITVT